MGGTPEPPALALWRSMTEEQKPANNPSAIPDAPTSWLEPPKVEIGEDTDLAGVLRRTDVRRGATEGKEAQDELQPHGKESPQ